MAASLAALTVMANVAPTFAASQFDSRAVAISNDAHDLGTFHVDYFEPTTVTWLYVDVDTSVDYSGSFITDVGWDGDHVRQGANLDVTRQAPLALGQVDVTWHVTGSIAPFNDAFGEIQLSESWITQSASCSPQFTGSDYTCSAGAPFWTVLPGFGPTTPYAKLAITTSFTISPQGAVVDRELIVGGGSASGPTSLPIDSVLRHDGLGLPCTAAAGDTVDYALTDFSWTPTVTGTQHLSLVVGMMDLTGLVELPGVGTSLPTWDINAAKLDAAFDIHGDGFVEPLGTLLANNNHPSIDPLAMFSGNEGSPISFSASVTSTCGIDSYVWQFSNGTTSYGPAPQRAFSDNGLYDGQLTVTDVTGLSATRAFSVDVSNLAPAANAGPDTYADWGRLIQFNGQATDPGSGDQSTLQYQWIFGDGTPIATGGASVLHAYSMPGTYIATFQACDKDGACTEDTRTVTVTKRDTVLGYTGPLSSRASKVVTLTSHLEDEYGQAVAGRQVIFTLGSQQAIGTTDGNGNAVVSFKLTQKPGSYDLAVVFPAGDARYYDSVDAGRTFVIGK